ncbi:MAG: succinylglutamate desuccinylase [Verrucomicrobiaceae bacterium]|nr:MAG: succinylglutamate desuccinylase [Verrucomicrobiaceae bacterium]
MSDAFDWTAYHAAFHMAAENAGFSPTVLLEFPSWPLVAWERPGSGKRVYLSAGIHGDEPAGPLALLELLRGGFFTGDHHWSICPTLNPTGLAAGTRENADAMDLNRDYWLRGTREIIAHATWLDAMQVPDLFISLHEDWETTGFYFYEINLSNDLPERAHRILEAAHPWFEPEQGPIIDGHECRENGWIYHAAEPDLPEGWPEAIYLAKMGCPLSFTFESPSRAALHERVAAHAAAVRAACTTLFD